jgi:hypothetical protein
MTPAGHWHGQFCTKDCASDFGREAILKIRILEAEVAVLRAQAKRGTGFVSGLEQGRKPGDVP